MHGRRKMGQDECVKLGQKFRRYQGDDESEMKRNEEILMIKM
jgi:hypothetical protein